jgi:hypothetical protein
MTKRERSVVAAMLNVADLLFTEPDVHQVLVVEECNCGCPTIYFSTEGVRHWPVAEAYTTIERGTGRDPFRQRERAVVPGVERIS